MTFDGIPPDTLTPLVRRLNRSMASLAALGGALHLLQSGQCAHPDVADEMAAMLAALEVPPLDGLSPGEAAQVLGLIRTFFVEATDLLNAPQRPPGWVFEDPAILQGLGSSSAGMVARMTGLGEERPWFARLLGRAGTVLDVGTGVGGVALAAAAAWPQKSVVGIDIWAPSLTLAEANRAASPGGGERVRFQRRGLDTVSEVGAYDLIWLPTPFIDGDIVMAALPALLRSLTPGGAVIAGVLPPPEDGLGRALSRLRTIRNGGHPWSCEAMAALMTGFGFRDVEVPAGQAGVHFILGRAD